MGLCNGSIHGNSEILLKAALKGAIAFDPSITTSWIHVPSVALPRNHKPLRVNASIIPNRDDEAAVGFKNQDPDDREVVFNAIMEADALIIASPVYSHQPAGTLKALTDDILGPYADVSEAYRTLLKQKSGEPGFEDIQLDPRETKPRVAGFIAVAGSSSPFPEQWTMALPSMHIVTYPIHARVVDQVVFPGFATAGAVLLDIDDTVERAKCLGVRVARQIGRQYDEVKYLGPEEEGSCPYCHLCKVEFREDNHVVCIVCGANGTLTSGPDGKIRPTWEKDSDVSCLTLKGKWKHLDDIAARLGSQRSKMPSVQEAHDCWNNIQIPLVDLPSMHADTTSSLDRVRI